MAAQNTFDIVSKIEMQEIDNAINQAMKEVVARFDFKGSKSKIHLEGKDKLIRVQIGPYTSEAEATKVKARLGTEGYTAISKH